MLRCKYFQNDPDYVLTKQMNDFLSNIRREDIIDIKTVTFDGNGFVIVGIFVFYETNEEGGQTDAEVETDNGRSEMGQDH